jgi:UDP-glucose 4-epimerase
MKWGLESQLQLEKYKIKYKIQIMNILIIGCNGFIGSHLAYYFYKLNFTIVGCDIGDFAATFINYFKTNQQNEGLENFISNNKIDYCINAAGSGNVSFSIQNPLVDFGSNTYTTIKILDLIKTYRPNCKYIHLSSAAVYGNPNTLPLTENHPQKPISPYGYHKWMSEIICSEYYNLYKIPITIIRIFSIYGTGQRKLLLWDICNKLMLKNEIQLFGTGLESRDYIHIQDFASLIDCIIKVDYFQGDVINAGSGKETTIREIADIFSRYYKGTKKISFSGNARNGDPSNWKSDISKAKSLGFNSITQLDAGIIEYIQWFNSINEYGQ